MRRLYLTVEGQTEAAFAESVLKPHLANFQVYLTGSRFTGLHSRRGGRIPQGGLLGTFQHALSDIRRWLSQDRSPDARFSIRMDFYHLPRDFPGYDQGMARRSGQDQATALEDALARVIQHERFIPYLQVHEFEALVLCDPRRIASFYQVRDAELRRLFSDCQEYASPEEINHGQHSHPKFRIKQVFPTYDENVAGPLLIEGIGLPKLRETCPHFGGWLGRLESLDE